MNIGKVGIWSGLVRMRALVDRTGIRVFDVWHLLSVGAWGIAIVRCRKPREAEE